MKKYSIPVVYTITGWVTVKARTLDKAISACDGNMLLVEVDEINDANRSYELFPLEAKPIKEGK